MKILSPSFIIIIFFLLDLCRLYGQNGNTVGLIKNEIDSYNGYTLLAPTSSEKTFLIDNCGKKVNTWMSDYKPGLTAHLTKDGKLLRSGRIESDFLSGGSGGIVQLFSWGGNLIWEAVLSKNLDYHQHHDVKAMPNGNILVLAWEYNSPSEALQLGRYPDLVSDEGLWTELIMEIQPLGTSDFLVIWEWHMNDHLIQDYDQTKNNYGIISEHPELIDINYEGATDLVDRFHANALDYNEELDQIVINLRNYNEFYILDHSTTTEEAANHSGGDSNMGGDLLYRYGNPITYQRGSAQDQKFFSQHGTNWIRQGQFKNGLIVFNNGINRPQGSFSSIEIVMPEVDEQHYIVDSLNAFGPESFDFAYVGTPTSSFYSPRLSNAVVLPNDNILITDGQLGKIFEITPQKEIVWEYINPVLGSVAVSQGENSPLSDVFASYRYPVDYSGLSDDLNPEDPIESNSIYDCNLTTEEVALNDQVLDKVQLLENPIHSEIIIRNDTQKNLIVKVLDVFGRQIVSSFSSGEALIRYQVDITPGYYVLQLWNEADETVKALKIIKI